MNVLDSVGISKENREQFILIRGGQLAGVAFLVKSSEARNHLNELSWNAVPEFNPGQTSNSTRGVSEVQIQPSDTQEQQPRMGNDNAAEAELSPNQGSKRSSILEEDLGLSITDDKDEEDENMGDGGQSSTHEDTDTDLSLLDRLHMEEAGETVLSETGIFTASLGNGNHRRETLDPFVWEGSIMSQQMASDSLVTFSNQLMTKSSMTQQPTQRKHKTLDLSSGSIMCPKCPTIVSRNYMKRHMKKYHVTRDEVTKSSSNNKDQNGVCLHTPRTSRRTLKEPPANASTPRPILNSDKYKCDYSVKCEYCGKRLLKKSLKQHVQKMHINKLLECRKCGSKFLREAAREVHEKTCVINYEVQS